MADENQDNLLVLTADIVAAHVSNNNVGIADLPDLIGRVHHALAGLGAPAEAPPEELKPAVSVRASVKPDHLVCLEDGKKLKMLKKHLSTDHGLTPQDYRARWNLPADYPMVAPAYAEQRRELAVKIGLGTKGRGGGRKAAAKSAAKPVAKPAPARRGRAPKSPAT